MTRRSKRGEFELIAEVFRPLAVASGALGLNDDAALVRPDPGHELVVTVDGIVAGVHFLPEDPPADVGRKLLRVNLSDLAAMGARPLGYVLVTMLTEAAREGWIDDFAAGLRADQDEFGIVLLGGDTVATPGPLAFTLTALGQARPAAVLLRSGARPGDGVYVSGTLGDASLGLRVLRGALAHLGGAAQEYLIARYRIPLPRVALGRRLGHIASAAIDVSDGLIADLGHVCETSGVAAEIAVADLPLSAAAREALGSEPALLAEVLGGGDDYELLFTVPPAAAAAVPGIAADLALPLTRIGAVRSGAGVTLRDQHGRIVEPGRAGFAHF